MTDIRNAPTVQLPDGFIQAVCDRASHVRPFGKSPGWTWQFIIEQTIAHLRTMSDEELRCLTRPLATDRGCELDSSPLVPHPTERHPQPP